MTFSRNWFATAARAVGLGPLFVIEATRAETPAAETNPDHPLLRDSFVFALGGHYPRTATTAARGPSCGGTGVVVDFEDILDLNKRNLTPMGGLLRRRAERWRVDLECFSVGCDATHTLTSEVQWGDQTFPVGTTVDSTKRQRAAPVSAMPGGTCVMAIATNTV